MLSRCHPLIKLAICLAFVAAACVVFDPLVLSAIIVLAAGVLIILEGVRPLTVFLTAIPFALFGLGFFTNAVLFRAEDGFIASLANEAPLQAEAANAGLTLFLRAVACGMVSFVFARTTAPGDLTRALMAANLVPTRFGYALFAVFNLAPTLWSDIRLARIVRAMRMGRAPRRILWPGEAAAIAIPILAGAIRQAGQTAIAMEARGLGRTRRPTLINVPSYGPRDLVLAVAATMLLAVLVGIALL